MFIKQLMEKCSQTTEGAVYNFPSLLEQFYGIISLTFMHIQNASISLRFDVMCCFVTVLVIFGDGREKRGCEI